MNTHNKQKTDLKVKISVKTKSVGGVDSAVTDSQNESKTNKNKHMKKKTKAVTQTWKIYHTKILRQKHTHKDKHIPENSNQMKAEIIQ